MDNSARIEKIRQLLTEAYAPSHLHIQDDSLLHVGHEGAKGGAGHFTVEITSPAFTHKSRVECHQMVYKTLADMLKTDIHALRIIAKAK